MRSFGVGGHVRLPGRSAESPNVYEFGTPYAAIKADLESQDAALYARNGLLAMVDRNAAVKRAPEKWQACRDAFDVVVCFEERVLEQVVDDLAARPQATMQVLLFVCDDFVCCFVVDERERSARARERERAVPTDTNYQQQQTSTIKNHHQNSRSWSSTSTCATAPTRRRALGRKRSTCASRLGSGFVCVCCMLFGVVGSVLFWTALCLSSFCHPISVSLTVPPSLLPRHNKTTTTQQQQPTKLDAAPAWEDVIDDALRAFEERHGRRATYTVLYY